MVVRSHERCCLYGACLQSGTVFFFHFLGTWSWIHLSYLCFYHCQYRWCFILFLTINSVIKIISINYPFAVHKIRAYPIAKQCDYDNQHHYRCSFQHSGKLHWHDWHCISFFSLKRPLPELKTCSDQQRLVCFHSLHFQLRVLGRLLFLATIPIPFLVVPSGVRINDKASHSVAAPSPKKHKQLNNLRSNHSKAGGTTSWIRSGLIRLRCTWCPPSKQHKSTPHHTYTHSSLLLAQIRQRLHAAHVWWPRLRTFRPWIAYRTECAWLGMSRKTQWRCTKDMHPEPLVYLF